MTKVPDKSTLSDFWGFTKDEIADQIAEALPAKQDKLTGQSGQVVGFDSSGNADAVQGWSNPNILINADFRKPVNRNELVEYVGPMMSIDKWNVGNVKTAVSIQDGFITLTSIGSYAQIRQYNSLWYKELSDKIVTASVLYRTEYENFHVAMFQSANSTIFEKKLPVSENWNLATYTFKVNYNADRVEINNISFRLVDEARPDDNEKTIDFMAVKLELGSQQTLAHQDANGNWVLNDPVDYEAEYTKCAQYDPQTAEWIGYDYANISPFKIKIPVNSDLNDYTKIGSFGATPGSVAKTIINRPPTDVAFSLYVMGLMGNSTNMDDYGKPLYAIQEIRTIDNNIWTRRVSKGSNSSIIQYDPWRKIVFDDELQNSSNLILQSACPTNRIIYDDVGKGGTYVYIPKFRLCDVMSTDDTSIHPAFIVNGQEIPGFYMGKFQSSVSDGRAYSLPAKDPTVSVNSDTVVNQNRAKGSNFHEVTVAEWSAIALWCHKNGTEPKGNNDYGKDISETIYKAAPTSFEGGKTARVATGTGPVSWSHDGTLEGIWDMNGNVWEWCTGMRLVHGELQVIPYNDAADPMCDLSATSAAWKAIKAAATSWDDLFVTPDGNGTTQGTVKLDWDGVKWVYSTTIAHATASKGCTLASVTADTNIGDQAKLLLQVLAMLPDTELSGDGIAANYNDDYLYANNANNEYSLRCGGRWSNGANCGVFYFNLGDKRSYFDTRSGGRSAFIDLPTQTAVILSENEVIADDDSGSEME